MTAPRRYRYRPAALRAPLAVTLDGPRLETGDGAVLRLDTVEQAAFVNHTLRGARIMRLDLVTDGARRSLGYNGDAQAWADDPDAAEFLRLVADILRELQTHAPKLDVSLGETGRPRLGMFAVGVVSILAGAGIFIAALATGVAGERLAAAAVPMALLVVLGGLLVHGFAPWRRPPVGRPGAVAQTLEGIRARLPAAATARGD